MNVSRDHRLSLNPKEFQEMVEKLKLASISKGKSKRIEFDSEKDAVKLARRSIVSSRKIPINTRITEEMLEIKRPARGIEPKYFEKILGMKTINEIQEDVPIKWEDLDS